MRKINVLTTVFILLALFSCRKDDVFTEVDDPVFPDPGVELVSNYTGIVVNEEGLAVADAEVIDENGNITITDQNGYFKVAQGNFTQGGSLFKVKKTGFIDAYRFVHLQAGESGYARVILVEQKLKDSFQAGTGGQIAISEEGASVKIAANSVVQENGSEYSGEVHVYAHWYNPNNPNISASMPGDLRGLDENGDRVVLETYGMVSVELVGANGEELNLKENTTAELRFPIVENLLGSAPESIPLWSLNEESAYWVEEGTASKLEGEYVAQVSHFSFWNCDWPYPLVKLSGTVKDQDGNLLSYVLVSVTLLNGGICGTGFTDARGYFEGLVPKDEALLFNVISEHCSIPAYSKLLDPLTEDTNLGMIEVDLSGEQQLMFSGNVLDCSNNMPVSNGYVKLQDPSGVVYATVDINSDGSYSGSAIVCGSTELHLQAINFDAISESQVEIWITDNQENYLVPDLITCGSLDEFLKTTINGISDVQSTSLECWKINNVIDIIWSNDEGNTISYKINFNDIQNPVVESILIHTEKPDFPFMNFELLVNDFELTVDNYPTALGEYMEGSFEGNFMFDGTAYDISTSFRMELLRDEISVFINTWTDLNLNGIYDSGTEQLFANGTDFQITENNMVIHEAIQVANGRHMFRFQRGAIADIEVLLNGNSLTASNVDPSQTDNDFGQDGFLRDVVFDELKNYACGIIPGAMSCSSSSTIDCGNCAEVEVQGGIPPYTLIVNGQVIAPTPNGAITYCGQAGQYAYVVEDANGDECSGTLVISQSNVFEASLNEIIYKCENGEVLADVDVNVTGGTPPYMFEWNNGSVTEDLVDLSPGIYNLNVIDANGCETWLSSFTIESNYIEITGKVWDDNFGSIPNEYESEQGIVGVDISLIDENSGVIQTVTTDADGNYSMIVSNPGIYRLEIVESSLPFGFSLVAKDSASSDEVDSDADPTTFRTDEFTIVNACEMLDFDFGLK